MFIVIINIIFINIIIIFIIITRYLMNGFEERLHNDLFCVGWNVKP